MQIGMLGPFEVRVDQTGFVDIPGARLRALLIVLALNPGRVVPKATLVDWIWGDHPPADAANALHRLVSRLRKALPPDSVEGRQDGYRLLIEPDDVDAVRFERLAGRVGDDATGLRARRLREAQRLWRGAAMQDVGPLDSPAFDAAVTRLERLRLTAMEDRFDAEIELGHAAGLVTELTDLVAAHPVRERLVAALLRALAATGRESEALLVYQRTRKILAEELGADPSPELSALHVALLRGETGRRDDDRRTNLREELTSYIGKDADLAAVAGYITHHRLTTLTGPGGSGKTRLATETARTMLGDLPDGAWLVELAGLGPGGDLAQATLAALGLRDTLLGEPSGDEPLERLVAAIRERELLLVLDNCEHVIEATAALAHRLLGECPRLRILATSREPLGITGEALWPVAPLALPDHDARPGDIETSPAVRLLRDRAGAMRKDLAADDHALPTMARVCRALDGMPLAIELAASRLRTMNLEQLADRLDDRFRLLTGGSRTALPRHRTLRAMVDWSWEPLSQAERTVLRRLSVFADGASLEAAERVCVGDAVERADVLELLTALIDKSLLVPVGDGAPRYRMLSTIREYAARRLAEAGETESARRAHLDYFIELTRTVDPKLRRRDQLAWLAVLEAERENIAAALRGAVAAGQAQAAMSLAAGAGFYWWLSGHRLEGMELINAADSVPGDVDDETRAIVYGLAVSFASAGRAYDQDQLAELIHKTYHYAQRSGSGNPLLAVAVPLERMLREPDSLVSAWETLLDNADPWVRALGRLHMGKSQVMLGHPGRDADACLEQALSEFRALGERFGISFALTELADRVATRGEFATACEYYEQAARAVTEVGAAEDVIRMRARLAQLNWLMGDEDACAAAMAEAERNAEKVTWPEALVELTLAKTELARWRGDDAEAHRQIELGTVILGDKADKLHTLTHDLLGYLTEDLDQAREHRASAYRAAATATATASNPQMLAQVLVGVADLALRRGQYEQAARLLAAGNAVRGLPDRSNPDLTRIERAARNRLGDTGYAQAAAEGAETDPAQLVEITLAS